MYIYLRDFTLAVRDVESSQRDMVMCATKMRLLEVPRYLLVESMAPTFRETVHKLQCFGRRE